MDVNRRGRYERLRGYIKSKGQALQLTSGLDFLRHPSLSAVDGASIEGEGEKKQ